MKHFLLTVFFLTVSSAVFAGDLMELLGKKYEIFQADRPRFITPATGKYFVWTSDAKDSARYPIQPKPTDTLDLFGCPVNEVLVNFRENSVSNLYISVFNRGDSGDIKLEDFNAILRKVNEGIAKLTGNNHPSQLKGKLADSMFINARVWVNGDYAWLLKWSVSGRTKRDAKPEYIQVEIERYNPTDDPRERSLVTADRDNMNRGADLLKNIRKEPDGNVWIDNIPMVDQGAKGYCVAAVAERVLRYYGCPVTQHVIAQVAGSTAAGGTDVESMVEALRKLGAKFGVKVRNEYELFNPDKALATIDKILDKYNRLAKKAKKPKVEKVISGNTVFLDKTIMELDPELYMKVRTGDSDFKDFLDDVHKCVDAGTPVVWCVQLGILPEDKVGPQAKGGHMRLIVGYNDKNKEILYSDTWGMGHELKSMPAENAWTITVRTVHIEPRANR